MPAPCFKSGSQLAGRTRYAFILLRPGIRLSATRSTRLEVFPRRTAGPYRVTWVTICTVHYWVSLTRPRESGPRSLARRRLCYAVISNRTSLEASGIDVYTTVRPNGYPIEVLKTADCKGNYNGIVLFE